MVSYHAGLARLRRCLATSALLDTGPLPAGRLIGLSARCFAAGYQRNCLFRRDVFTQIAGGQYVQICVWRIVHFPDAFCDRYLISSIKFRSHALHHFVDEICDAERMTATHGDCIHRVCKQQGFLTVVIVFRLSLSGRDLPGFEHPIAHRQFMLGPTLGPLALNPLGHFLGANRALFGRLPCKFGIDACLICLSRILRPISSQSSGDGLISASNSFKSSIVIWVFVKKRLISGLTVYSFPFVSCPLLLSLVRAMLRIEPRGLNPAFKAH